MYSIKALAVLLLVGAAAAQYNYKAPEPPKNTYLPPTTQKPYQSQADVAADNLSPDGEHEPGMPFDFTYAVKEDDGNDFSHQAQSDGDVVKGEYRILLPDGRTQVVKYTADWKNGYNAEVTFEGEAVYPEPKPTTRPPPPPPRPTTRPPPPPPRPTNPPPRPVTRPPPPPPRPTTRNPYENQEDNDSQGLRPSPTPGYTYRPPPPPPTTRPTPAPYRPPPPPPTTRRPPPPPPTQGYNYQPPTTRRPPPPPPTTRPPPPPPPPGLYGTPNQPFGVRNNPKFGYSK